MTERHEFIRWCRKRHACEAGIQYVKGFKSPTEWWNNGRNTQYMLWVLAFVDSPKARYLRQTTACPFWFKPQIHGIPTGCLCDNCGPYISLAKLRQKVPECPWKRSA